VDPRFYGIRWLTLLMSQEFELPEVIRLWDSLFADTRRFELLDNVAVAMLVSKRKVLLVSDFGHCLHEVLLRLYHFSRQPAVNPVHSRRCKAMRI
jgi:hypothetical protein